MEEQSIAEIKAKTIDLCIHCGQELKVNKIASGGDIFGFGSSGTAAFYCENLKCKFYGYLTLGRKLKTEKVVEFKEQEKS